MWIWAFQIRSSVLQYPPLNTLNSRVHSVDKIAGDWHNFQEEPLKAMYLEESQVGTILGPPISWSQSSMTVTVSMATNNGNKNLSSVNPWTEQSAAGNVWVYVGLVYCCFKCWMLQLVISSLGLNCGCHRNPETVTMLWVWYLLPSTVGLLWSYNANYCLSRLMLECFFPCMTAEIFNTQQ